VTSGGLFTTDGAEVVAPRDAATVLLLRAGAPFEVFLVKRSHGSRFMGGMHVFPGGKLDPSDTDDRHRARLGPAPTAARLEPTPGRSLEEADRLGLLVACCRELFEEAGVLFAHPRGGTGPLRLDPPTRARLVEHRAALRAGHRTLAEVLEAEELELSLDGLEYLAHWITPSREARRYDTRFFLARKPEDQDALIDREELIAQTWRTPRAALDAYRAGEIDLAPPTLRILEDLAEQPSLEAAFDAARRRTVAPILPKLALHRERLAIVLPWDAAYPEAEGASLELDGPHPDADRPSRVVLDGERWLSERDEPA
jgi:8-oxo-dGTP pyrophosphatase MutT (NUDIX family)